MMLAVLKESRKVGVRAAVRESAKVDETAAWKVGETGASTVALMVCEMVVPTAATKADSLADSMAATTVVAMVAVKVASSVTGSADWMVLGKAEWMVAVSAASLDVQKDDWKERRKVASKAVWKERWLAGAKVSYLGEPLVAVTVQLWADWKDANWAAVTDDWMVVAMVLSMERQQAVEMEAPKVAVTVARKAA